MFSVQCLPLPPSLVRVPPSGLPPVRLLTCRLCRRLPCYLPACVPRLVLPVLPSCTVRAPALVRLILLRSTLRFAVRPPSGFPYSYRRRNWGTVRTMREFFFRDFQGAVRRSIRAVCCGKRLMRSARRPSSKSSNSKPGASVQPISAKRPPSFRNAPCHAPRGTIT